MERESLEQLEALVGALPGLIDVVRAAGNALTPEELEGLLTTAQDAFGGRTGVELLAAGEVAPVVAIVTHVVTPSDLDAPPS